MGLEFRDVIRDENRPALERIICLQENCRLGRFSVDLKGFREVIAEVAAIAQGPPEQVVRDPAVIHSYLGAEAI